MKINGDDTHPPVVFDIAMEALAHRKVGHVRSLTYYSIDIYIYILLEMVMFHRQNKPQGGSQQKILATYNTGIYHQCVLLSKCFISWNWHAPAKVE